MWVIWELYFAIKGVWSPQIRLKILIFGKINFSEIELQWCFRWSTELVFVSRYTAWTMKCSLGWTARNFTARPCHAWNDFSITFVFYYIILRNSLIKYCFIIDRVKNIIAFLNKRPTDHNIIIYWCLFYQRTPALFHS